MMQHNYDKKGLFDIHFDSTYEEEELGSGIAAALGEKLPEIIIKAVGITGKSVAIDLYKKCQEIEKNGGMLVENARRRRTPGGVFLRLFKTDDRISEADKKEFFNFASELQNQMRCEQSRGKVKKLPTASQLFSKELKKDTSENEVCDK